MIVVWPLLLVGAGLVAMKSRPTMGGRGWKWTVVWIVAGFLWSLSLAAGFSVGLFLLPIAAVVLIWVAGRSPHLMEASGFVGGIALTIGLLSGL